MLRFDPTSVYRQQVAHANSPHPILRVTSGLPVIHAKIGQAAWARSFFAGRATCQGPRTDWDHHPVV